MTSNLALYFATNPNAGQYHHLRSHLPCPLGSVHRTTKQASCPTGTARVSYFSIETVTCELEPERLSCTAFPTWRGSRVISAAAFACTTGEAVLKAPRNRSSCWPPLAFLKRQNGALAPPRASTPLESLKMKTVPGAGQTTSTSCACTLPMPAAAANPQATTAPSHDGRRAANRRVTSA